VFALRRRLGLIPIWLVLSALVVVVLTTLDVLHRGLLTSFDHDLSRQMVELNLHAHPWPKRLVYIFTLFGQRGTVLVLTIPLTAYLCWRSRSSDPVVRYVIALLALTAVVYGFKDGIGRTAPPVDLLHTSSGQSYPSGHLTNAILIWGLTWWCARRIEPGTVLTRVLAIVRIAGPISVVVAMTLLNYHWASDFVAAAGVGVVLLAAVTHPALDSVSHRLDQMIERRRVRPSATP